MTCIKKICYLFWNTAGRHISFMMSCDGILDRMVGYMLRDCPRLIMYDVYCFPPYVDLLERSNTTPWKNNAWMDRVFSNHVNKVLFVGSTINIYL